MNQLDDRLETLIPHCIFQVKLDQLGHFIEDKFKPLSEFNEWLNHNGQGTFYEKLAIFLAKLPVRSARDIIQLLHSIVKTALYTAVHPLKSLNALAKLLLEFVFALTQPQTYAYFGAGTIGVALGQPLVTGHPFSLFALGIGGALLLGGISATAIKAAIQAEQNKRLLNVKDALLTLANQLPETFLTSFIIGIILGGIQKISERNNIEKAKADAAQKATRARIEKVKADALQYLKDTGLDVYYEVELDASGNPILLKKPNTEHIYRGYQGPAIVERSYMTYAEREMAYLRMRGFIK